MTKHSPLAGGAARPLVPPASDIGAARPDGFEATSSGGVSSPTGEAGAPNLSTHSDPENFIELGYGTGPRCIQCKRSVYGCLCNREDIDAMPVEDMKRVMPQLFDEPDYGWGLAERSAYGMGGSK